MRVRLQTFGAVKLFLVLIVLIFMTTCSDTQSPAPNPKKGVSFWNDDQSYNRFSRGIDALGCSWYYNWTAKPDARSQEIKAQFVPMIWDAGEANKKNFEALKKSDSKILLGFNEPDNKGQADMSVEDAIRLWPLLMETGMRLGSPAPAAVSPSRDWLARFMKEAEARNYRVDFICLHWYGDITDPDAVEHLKVFLESQWKLYKRPIWLTEFSGSTGSWLEPVNPPVTAEKNAAFIRKALPMLNSLPYVERYAWFEMKWNEAPWAKVALVNPRDGKMTVAGKAYHKSGN